MLFQHVAPRLAEDVVKHLCVCVQRVMQEGPTAQLPALAQVAGLAEQRRVILTCEKAIVLLDIISKRVWLQAPSGFCVQPKTALACFIDVTTATAHRLLLSLIHI